MNKEICIQNEMKQSFLSLELSKALKNWRGIYINEWWNHKTNNKREYLAESPS